MSNEDVHSPGIFASQNLTGYLDQHTILRARNQVNSVSQDRFKNNASAPVRAELNADVYSKIESDYRDAVTRNQRHFNRSEVNLTKQTMYPQAQNYIGRKNSQANSTARNSERSNKALKAKKNKSGFKVRKLLDKVEDIRHGSGKDQDLQKRLPLQAGLYLEHPSIFKGKKKESQVAQSQIKDINSDLEEHRQMLRKFPSSPFENIRFMPVPQLQKKQESALQSKSPMSPQFDYLVAKSFLQGESSEMEQRAQRISKLQALCMKTASAVQELKNEVRKGNFELPQQTIGPHSQSQTTATHNPKKRNKIMTPIDLVNTGINLLYATQRVDSHLPDINKLNNSQLLFTPKHKQLNDENYGGLLLSQDASYVKFASGSRAQSAAQRKRQTNMIQLFKNTEGAESLPGLHDDKKRRIQSAIHRNESESGTGFNSQLLKNYIRPQSSETRLTQHEIQYLSGFIEQRLKETNINNIMPSKMKDLIEGAIKQFLVEKEKQHKLPEIEMPQQKNMNQQMARSTQKQLEVYSNKSRTTNKSDSHIEIHDIDSIKSGLFKAHDSGSNLAQILNGRTPSPIKEYSPVKSEVPTSPINIADLQKVKMMKNMLVDAIWKTRYHDLKPVLEEKKRLQRQHVFKQDSRQGNKIFQDIYERDIHKFKKMLHDRQSKSQKPLPVFQEPPQAITQGTPIKKKEKKDKKERVKESNEQLNIDIVQKQNLLDSHRSHKSQPASARKSHRSKQSQHSSRQHSRVSAQKSFKSVNFGLNVGQTTQITGIDEVMDTVKQIKKQITKKDIILGRQSSVSRREQSPSKASETGSSAMRKKEQSPIKIAFAKLASGLASLVDQNLEGPFITDEVKAVMQGLQKKQALASGLSKPQLAIVVDEIKTELDNLKKRASYSSHQLHFLNLVDYYKPLEIPEKKVHGHATQTNILINVSDQDLKLTKMKKSTTFELPKIIEQPQVSNLPMVPQVVIPEEISKENPLMKYLKEAEEQKIAMLIKTSIKSGAVEEELEHKIKTCEKFSHGQLGKEQIKAHILDWKTMDTDVKQLGNFMLEPFSDEMIGQDLQTSFESKHGFNILNKFLETTELIKDELCNQKHRRTNSAPKDRKLKQKVVRDAKIKTGCHFWPKAFEYEHASSFNAHLGHTYVLMDGKNPSINLLAFRKEILIEKSLLYDKFWSRNGRITDIFKGELQMQMKWKVDEEERINKLEGQILQQIEGMEVYNMIGPKPSDKSQEVISIEKIFFKKIQFVTGSFLDVNQLPDVSQVVTLTDWRLKCINQDALVFKCIGNPNQQTNLKIFEEAIKKQVKHQEASYIQFADIKQVEPSVDLLWLLYFDDQLIAAMANILSTPFNPVGVLENLRMELNIVYMNQFERYLQKIKGKRMKRVGISFKPKRSKLLKGAQQFFGDQVVRRHEAQSKIAVHFLRTKTTVDQANENLINFSEITRPFRQLQSKQDIIDIKKQFQLPTIYEMKNDILMQPYVVHDTAPLHTFFRNKNEKMLYGEHRRKISQKIWGRFKQKSGQQLELMSLSLTESSSIDDKEKDYDSAPTRAHKEPGKTHDKQVEGGKKRISKPLFYKYAPVQIEQFPYEVDAYGNRVKIIHKDDAIHSLFKEPVRLYQHFSHVQGFHFYRRAKQTHDQIQFFDIYLPVRNYSLMQKVQEALRRLLTQKVLEMQQVKKIQKVDEYDTLTVPKPSIKRISPDKVEPESAVPQTELKGSQFKEKQKKKSNQNKVKPNVVVAKDLKKPSTSHAKKKVQSASKKQSTSPNKLENVGLDFNKQMQMAQKSGRRSNRNSTMKQIIYSHPTKQKNIEVGIYNDTPILENESEHQQQEEDVKEPIRRTTSEIINNGKKSFQRASSAGQKRPIDFVQKQHFTNQKSSVFSSLSGVTESQDSNQYDMKVSEPKVSRFSESVSDNQDFSPISQSFLRKHRESSDPSKPMKIIPAHELKNKYPNRLVIQPLQSSNPLSKLFIQANKKMEQTVSPKKLLDYDQNRNSSSIMSDIPSISSGKQPSRAEKLQKILDLKDKMQRSKKSAARAKAKKQAASKDPKGGNLDTPKKKERSQDSKESGSSPDWQLNKSNKASKQQLFQLNPLKSAAEAFTTKLPKFISKKDLGLKIKK